MRLTLAYDGPEGEPFEVPDAHLAAVLEPRPGRDRDEARLYEEALAEPVAGPPLVEAAEGAGSVLLLVDDTTRGTPVADILPHVAHELERAGVPDEAVTLLTAQGTHRAMNRSELERKIGAPFLERWRVEQHDHEDDLNLTHLGFTRSGMPVIVNSLLPDSDLVLGIGHVGAHGIIGYSGGAKIVVPGVAGAESEESTHWRAAQTPEEHLMGVAETPYRRDIEEAARMAGLDAVLNVVMDARGRVQHAAYGEPVRTHRACARVARDLYGAPLDEPADVVLVEAKPADMDYWQSVKGLYTGTLCVREGGAIVLVAPNPEGVARNHPNVLDLAGLTPREIRDRVSTGGEADVIGAAVALFTARFRERSRVTLVSGGVTQEECRKLGFASARTPQEALDRALPEAGPDARVVVIRHGGGTLPLVRGRNADAVAQSFHELAARLSSE